MNKAYFTITGTHLFYGPGILEKNMEITLVKNPNEHDNETIEIKSDGLDTVGYVANSVYTRKGTSYSAGRLYDKISDCENARVEYILDNCALGSLDLPMEKSR